MWRILQKEADMHVIRRLGCLSALAAGCTVLMASTAGAASILVTNFSFELPVLASGGFTLGCPTGWDCGSSNVQFQGVLYPTTAQYTPGADGLSGSKIVPEGNQVAWQSGQLPQVIQQNVGLIAANTTYTLNAWAGYRNDVTDPWPGPTIQLTANGAVVASLATTDPGKGNWGDFSLPWDSLAGDVGQTLGIVLLLNGTHFTDAQVNWDDVTLTATSAVVPLPGALPLFAGGLGLLGWFARRKKRMAAVAS